MDKGRGHELLYRYKIESLEKNKELLYGYIARFGLEQSISCNLMEDDIRVVFCDNRALVRKWKAFTHLVSSLPWRGSVGRQLKVFVMCGDCILGMVHLTSPLAQLRARDELLGWDKDSKWKEKQINRVYNIETCVPTRKYAPVLTGKLLVYLIFSREVIGQLYERYGDEVLGFETTSLFGESSMYNRIPFLRYLGLTDGLSGVYLTDTEWRGILKEYYEVFPCTKTSRLAPAKFQIVDKLRNYYKTRGLDFPYLYQSEQFRRGIYFGFVKDADLPIAEMVTQWRQRWLLGRLSRGYKPDVASLGLSQPAEDWLNRIGYRQLSFM